MPIFHVRDGAFKARERIFKNKTGKQRLVFIFGRGPFDQALFHSSFYTHRRASGCAAAELGLFEAETSSLGVGSPVRTSIVGLCRSGRDPFRTAEL